MKLFKCQSCGQLLYFENTSCERCSHRLGYLPQAFTVSAVEPVGERWKALADPEHPFRFCDNAGYDACNWLMEADDAGALCAACRHNHIIPDLSVADNVVLWRLLELNKHRLFYTLQRLRLPLATRIDDPEHGLAFDFLAESPSPKGPKVLTGHDNGLITIALEEADAALPETQEHTAGLGEFLPAPVDPADIVTLVGKMLD